MGHQNGFSGNLGSFISVFIKAVNFGVGMLELIFCHHSLLAVALGKLFNLSVSPTNRDNNIPTSESCSEKYIS